MRSLEEYIVDMEKRNTSLVYSRHNQQQDYTSMNGNGGNHLGGGGGGHHLTVSGEDVWTQLQHKENDLQLAAELGKALLDKNEELKRQQEQIVDEYSKKLEEVEQDRHLLKRKFATRESEYEARILELEKDIHELHDKLAAKDQTIRAWEKEKSGLFTELTAQNSRLTTQLKESQIVENQLQSAISELKEQCQMGKATLQAHAASVEALKDEVDLLSEKKAELERRLQLMVQERESISADLEEERQRTLVLQRHARDQDVRYQQTLNDFQHVENESTMMSMEDRLNNGGDQQRSLLVEMDISEPTLSQECMTVYRQLRSYCQQLKTHYNDDSGLHSDLSTHADDAKNLSVGLLSEVAQELLQLVLDSDVVRFIERIEQARLDVQQRDAELAAKDAKLQQRDDAVNELSSKLSVKCAELEATVEERDRARNDASHTSLNQDELVARAREVRDAAVSRKNKAEIELAKVRVELMQANSQLMEAVQQKVELHQQLEQWQVDMQELIDEQMKSKLTSQEMQRITSSTNGSSASSESMNGSMTIASTTRRRLMQLFQR